MHGMHPRVVDPGSHGSTLLASECLALVTSLLGGRVSLYNSDTNYNVYVFFAHHQAILDTWRMSYSVSQFLQWSPRT